MSSFLIKDATIIDPITKKQKKADICLKNGKIVSKEELKAEKVIAASGLIAVPGLIDLHAHLREPGREDEETIYSGSLAAALGGYTTVVCMPNTNPPLDSLATLKYVQKQAQQAVIEIKFVGAVTKEQKGEELAPLGELAAGGVVGFSDDGFPVANANLMRRALEYSRIFNLPIISHAEDKELAKGGVMNEGRQATLLGLTGIPAAAETVAVARDIALAELTGARLHLTHLSTAAAVELVRQAKAKGLAVTADCTVHHLVLTEDCLATYDTNYKVNPPLRTEADIAALRQGLLDNTIDAITTDHAPHALFEKEKEIEAAPFGMIGLQTAVSVLLTHLVPEVGLETVIQKLTVGPAKILNKQVSGFTLGSKTDLVLINPKAKVKVDADWLKSKSKNTPFLGQELNGLVAYVIKDGRLIVKEGELVFS